MQHDADFQMALLLQKQFEVEHNVEHPPADISYQNWKKPNKHSSSQKNSLNSSRSLIDPSWELVDPTPNIYVLFVQFNEKFFWNKLLAVSVDWSKRMTTCAGICSYQGRGGMCRITLSEPLLKLRPRKDLIETLLHEMIHAFLFVTHNNKDRDGHGPEFHRHMYRINGEAGTHITVYHDFHDEVRLYKVHWWRCDGPCVKRPPYFGMVRRAMNRAPGPYDRWWPEHQQRCGGQFIKVKEPEKKDKTKRKETNRNVQDIRKFIPTTTTTASPLNNNTFNNNNNKTNWNKSSGKQGTINRNGTVVLNPKTRVEKENIPTTVAKGTGIIGFPAQTVQPNSTNVILPKKSKENVPSSGNIVGFKDLAQSSGQSAILNAFPGGGNILTDTKIQPTSNPDYSVVRNHWVNKFTNNNLASPAPDIKRKSVGVTCATSKKSKIDTMASAKRLSCPNCNKSLAEEEINTHLDTCLSADVSIQSEFSSDLNESTKSMVECPVCETVLEADILNSHLDECLMGETQPAENRAPAKNVDKSANSGDSLKLCEICDTFVESARFELHVQACLNAFYDDIETKYDLNKQTDANVSVMCLVCNKSIVKSDLDNHLEDCMVSVFDKDVDLDGEMEKEEGTVDLNDSKCYNCPICMVPMDEENMNAHIDRCLNSAAENENIFN